MIFITSIESTSLIANLHNVFTSPIFRIFPRINAIISRTNVYIGQSLVHIRLIYIYIHERYIIAWNLTTVALFGTPAFSMADVSGGKRESKLILYQITSNNVPPRRSCTWKITRIILRNIETRSIHPPMGFEGAYWIFQCIRPLPVSVSNSLFSSFYIDYPFQWNPLRGRI